MLIKNALVFGADKKFIKRDVFIRNGIFVDEGNKSDEDEVIDANGTYCIPGLIDIHIHGAVNSDVCDATAKAYAEVAKYEAMNGITAICPATLTLRVDELEKVLKTGASFSGELAKKTPDERHEYADIVGFNMEGPFISRIKKGAQNGKYIIPCDAGIVDRFIKASDGLVKIIGLAPEENPDFENYIDEVKGKVIVSLAHTNAGYETAMKAFRAGASHAVHLYNAMTGLEHREPGVVGAVSDSAAVNAELITDGVHVHEGAVHAAFKMNGEDRIVFISDSLRCAGMPDGEYILGGQEIIKEGRFARLKEGGNIAGSVSNLRECMVNAVKEMNIPLETAVACSTINPARAIKIDDSYGSIESGKKGHALLLNREDLSLNRVIKDGFVI